MNQQTNTTTVAANFKEIPNYCVNAFTAKKIRAKPLAICWQNKPDASVWQ